jgi:hypothetical protein
MKNLNDKLKHHVTGAIERGEAKAIETVVATGHTPGPYYKAANFHQTGRIVNESGDVICDVYLPQDGAVLAAAPEMLSALEIVMLTIKDIRAGKRDGGTMGQLSLDADIIENAIKKAKGGKI